MEEELCELGNERDRLAPQVEEARWHARRAEKDAAALREERDALQRVRGGMGVQSPPACAAQAMPWMVCVAVQAGGLMPWGPALQNLRLPACNSGPMQQWARSICHELSVCHKLKSVLIPCPDAGCRGVRGGAGGRAQRSGRARGRIERPSC